MKTVGKIILAFSILAFFISIEIFINIPSAYSEFSNEPEDLYILIFLLVISLGSALFWLKSGLRLITEQGISRVVKYSLILSYILLFLFIIGLIKGIV